MQSLKQKHSESLPTHLDAQSSKRLVGEVWLSSQGHMDDQNVQESELESVNALK
jgi:hypothetical protein